MRMRPAAKFVSVFCQPSSLSVTPVKPSFHGLFNGSSDELCVQCRHIRPIVPRNFRSVLPTYFLSILSEPVVKACLTGWRLLRDEQVRHQSADLILCQENVVNQMTKKPRR